MKNLGKLFLTVIFAVRLLSPEAAQSGGQFEIKQSVTAGGGAASSCGDFGVTGTIAQANAGANSTNGQFLRVSQLGTIAGS